MFSRHKALVAGACALVLVLAWQAATVSVNHGGDWSALFYIGDRWPLPPGLADEGVRIFSNDPGYDGAFYHLVAHDPWLKQGFWRYADNPRLRWRRILVPGLAHLLAFGKGSRIHAAYIAVNLLFVFVGTWWLARFCRLNSRNEFWGLGFLAVPSVMVSIDRLTVDVALSALIIGLFVYLEEKKEMKTAAVLLFCPLARETGLCFNAAKTLWSLANRDWKGAVRAIATAIPFVVWATYVFSRTWTDGTRWISWPFAGILHRTFHPAVYPITGPWVRCAAVLDYLALIGIWAAILFTARFAWKRKTGVLETCLYVFVAAALFMGKEDIWAGAYEFGRTMSPILILLGLCAIRERRVAFLLPLACVLPRVLLQFEPQLRSMIQAAWSMFL